MVIMNMMLCVPEYCCVPSFMMGLMNGFLKICKAFNSLEVFFNDAYDA